MLAQVPEIHRRRFKGAIRDDLTLRDRLYALAARPDQNRPMWLKHYDSSAIGTGCWSWSTGSRRNTGRSPRTSERQPSRNWTISTASTIAARPVDAMPEKRREEAPQ